MGVFSYINAHDGITYNAYQQTVTKKKDNMKKLIMSLCLSMVATGAALADTYIGYTNTDFVRSGGVRYGSSTTQGLAIMLPKEKLDLLRGTQINGVRAVFGTRNMSDLTFFVTTDLDGTPEYTQEASGGTYQWGDFAFDEPYTIGDEEVLYVGYTITVSSAYRPLMFDGAMGIVGRSFVYTDSGWEDCYSLGYGNANIQLSVSGDVSFTDLILKDFDMDGYYQAGHSYSYTGQVFNFGTEPITSFDVTFVMGGEEQTYSFTDLDIEPNSTYDFDLLESVASESGSLAVEMSVDNINGSDDDDTSDNSFTGSIYMYPSDMRRAVLLEGFTGQSCSNCPSGHQTINSALSQYDGDVVEIFHHIGYYPDYFTMSEESFYLNFYYSETSSSTYAPAFMVNRMLGENSTTVVQEVSQSSVLSMLNQASAVQPYFSVDFNTNYDANTRTVSGSVDVYTHVMPETDTIMIGLYVVQDSIIAYQSSGGSEYVHRYAYRGSLFGTIGARIYPEEGVLKSYSLEYELPDSIISTYYGQTAFATDTANMYLVALVSKYYVGTSSIDCPVYNVAMVKMCTNNVSTGISETVAANDGATIGIDVSGSRVSVSGNCNRIAVYDMSGRLVQSFDGNTTEFTLPKGLYIIRAGGENGTATRKVAVK